MTCIAQPGGRISLPSNSNWVAVMLDVANAVTSGMCVVLALKVAAVKAVALGEPAFIGFTVLTAAVTDVGVCFEIVASN